VNRGDALIERGSDGLRALSEQAAARGGVAGKLSEPLAEDADFLRKLKPSLIKARLHGEEADEPAPSPPPAVRESTNGGPNPLGFVGAAFAVGIVAAKMLDWRGHAHPRG
jgi:hypothetical protein